jgi:dTDP-4-dehydrorhamnose reductase
MGPIVIVGALGQLGQALRRVLADRSPIALDVTELDVGDPTAVDRRIGELRPAVVLNTSAFNHVDDAELHPGEAFRTNAIGPWALARATDACGALLVHFSTDYVFRGDARTPYGEDDVPAPQSVYGASKLAGECLVAGVNPLHMVVRTAGLYGRGGRGGKGQNFVETMVRLGAEGRAIRVVDDQRVSPTSAADLARKIVELVNGWTETRRPELLGLYHVTNAGSCSWFELARETFRLCGSSGRVEPVTSAQYGARARRPAYSVLARRHLERLGLDDLRPWPEALADYLAEPINPRNET